MKRFGVQMKFKKFQETDVILPTLPLKLAPGYESTVQILAKLSQSQSESI